LHKSGGCAAEINDQENSDDECGAENIDDKAFLGGEAEGFTQKYL
jgi:hypothetical protein